MIIILLYNPHNLYANLAYTIDTFSSGNGMVIVYKLSKRRIIRRLDDQCTKLRKVSYKLLFFLIFLSNPIPSHKASLII